MKPAIPLIMMASCALITACSTTPSGARLGDGFTGPNLQHFVLPRVQVENESLQTALQRVNETIRTTAELCGEHVETLDFQFKGEPENRISADLRNLSADTAIRSLAVQAGMQPVFKGRTIELTAFPVDPAIATREFKVPPTFLTDQEWFTGAARNSIERGSGNPASLSRFFRKHHLMKSSQGRASYEPRSSTLRVTSTKTDLARVDAWVEIYISQTPRMIKLESTTLTFERDPGWKDSVISLREAERRTKRAERSRSAEVVKLPSVTARPGQEATIEVIREWIDDGGTTYFGTRLGFEGNPFGNESTAKLAYQRNLLDQEGRELLIADQIFPPVSSRSSERSESDAILRSYTERNQRPQTRTRTTRGSFVIPEEKVLVLRATGTSRKFEFLLVRAIRIDATGRQVRSLR